MSELLKLLLEIASECGAKVIRLASGMWKESCLIATSYVTGTPEK